MTKRPNINNLQAEFIAGNGASSKLLIVLHGLGDSSAGYRFLPQELHIPELNYLLLNAPDSYFIGYSWFQLPPGNPADGIIRSRKKLFQLLDDLEKQGWNLQKDVALLGFSQGALMVLDVATRYPKLLAGIVAISGFVFFLEKLPSEFSPVAKQQNILTTHGTFDSMVPIESTRQQILMLQKLGMNIEWQEYEKEHTIDPHQEIATIRVFLKSVLALRGP